MSIHTDRAFRLAQSKGACAAYNREAWDRMMALPKRELAEIAFHLAWLASDGGYGNSHDDALRRLFEERAALKGSGNI